LCSAGSRVFWLRFRETGSFLKFWFWDIQMSSESSHHCPYEPLTMQVLKMRAVIWVATEARLKRTLMPSLLWSVAAHERLVTLRTALGSSMMYPERIQFYSARSTSAPDCSAYRGNLRDTASMTWWQSSVLCIFSPRPVPGLLPRAKHPSPQRATWIRAANRKIMRTMMVLYCAGCSIDRRQ
jgi:hypothetical protein